MSSEITTTELQEVAERIRLRLRSVSEEMIEIGKEILAVKAKLPHGQFGDWVTGELGMSGSTAQNFMNVARNESRIGDASKFSPSALYSLVASSVPEEALETAKEVAKTQDKPVSKKQAKEIVEQTRKTFVYEGEEVFSTLPNERSLKKGDKVRYGGGFLSDRDMAMVRPITGSLGSFAVRKAYLREVEEEEPETYSLKPKLKTEPKPEYDPVTVSFAYKNTPADPPEIYEEEIETVPVRLQRVPKPEQSEDKIRAFCEHVATNVETFLEFPIALDRRKFLSEVYFGKISEGFILLSVDVMESPDIPDLLKAATAIAFIREEGMLVLFYFGRSADKFCAPYEGLDKSAFLTLIDMPQSKQTKANDLKHLRDLLTDSESRYKAEGSFSAAFDLEKPLNLLDAIEVGEPVGDKLLLSLYPELSLLRNHPTRKPQTKVIADLAARLGGFTLADVLVYSQPVNDVFQLAIKFAEESDLRKAYALTEENKPRNASAIKARLEEI